MNNYVVLYRIESIMTPLDAPFGFQCYADNTDHAEEQCINAYADADVVWVWQGAENVGIKSALANYWGCTQ